VRQVAAKAFLLSLALLTVCARGAENGQFNSTPSDSVRATDAPEVLANQTRAIFSVKCVECHGADLERPKGKFGYVLDLARVAANPKMIVPGNPKKSELYQMLVYDEMPGKGNTKGPLMPEQKDMVKRWIEAGAPAPTANESVPAARPLTLGHRIIRDIGQFHALTTHFPIALLVVALPAELMWTLTQKDS
jgi:Planctomycete cytochrome C